MSSQDKIDHLCLLLKSDDPDIIEQALDNIGDLKPVNAFELILPFMEHTIASVRETAACNLGEIKDERAIPHLMQAARNDEESVRKHALKSLENYNRSDIHELLLEEVSREKLSRGPLQVVAHQLAMYPGKQSRDALVYLILTDDDPYAFIPAIDALYSMKDIVTNSSWKQIIQESSHPYVLKMFSSAIRPI